MNKIFSIIAMTLLLTSFTEAKIIEVEDGESFVGLYNITEQSSPECTSRDSAFDTAQVLIANNPFYKGLKVSVVIGEQGQGLHKLADFDMTKNRFVWSDTNYEGSEKIVRVQTPSDQSGVRYNIRDVMTVDSENKNLVTLNNLSQRQEDGAFITYKEYTCYFEKIISDSIEN